MVDENWRLSRNELRLLLVQYEKAVEEDTFNILRPNTREKRLLGEAMIRRRAEAVRRARDANRKFIEAIIDDLPDLCDPPGRDGPPPRPLVAARSPENPVPPTPASSYGSLASVFLHVFRDWSTACAHVGTSTYGPALEELRALLPQGGEVLVPGAGLGRLALTLAAAGYKVEANEGSRLFVTVADYLFNRAPAAGMPIFPLAHVFSENWGHAQQYVEVTVPSPAPVEVLDGRGDGAVALFPGDFVKIYGPKGPGNRRFDAIVTSFFLDCFADMVEAIDVMDGLLAKGGVWVNIGPLNWQKEARLKLCWEEVRAIWENLGYEFVVQKSADVDYSLPRGAKMYTESYMVALTAAVKRQD